MKIGYQGIEGSNSEEAAYQLAKKMKFKGIEYVPLVNSLNVVNALIKREIDYAVMASNNNTAGVVQETAQALNIKHVYLLEELVLPIHHCIFKKPGADDKKLKKVASHIQALLQTRETRKKLLPKVKELETEDTAISAVNLKEGLLDDTVCVICSKKAGEINNLELMYENVEDKEDNQTTFGLYKI